MSDLNNLLSFDWSTSIQGLQGLFLSFKTVCMSGCSSYILASFEFLLSLAFLGRAGVFEIDKLKFAFFTFVSNEPS
jgi:hypothetical protein